MREIIPYPYEKTSEEMKAWEVKMNNAQMTQDEWNETVWRTLADPKNSTILGWFSLEEVRQIVKPCKAHSRPIQEELRDWVIKLDDML